MTLRQGIMPYAFFAVSVAQGSCKRQPDIKVMPESFKEIAYRVLKEKERSMNYRDLAREVLKSKKLEGKTPEATLRIEMTKDSRFVRVEPGVYGLAEWKKRK